MADNRILFQQPIIPPSGTTTVRSGQNSQNAAKNGSSVSFNSVLQKSIDESQELKFSRHATERISDRNIEMTPQTMAKLNEAVDKAEAKGSRESLILMQDAAFVVSVKNRTVITAVDKDGLNQNVFTNIDSAIVMD